jgi:hypothetical protein
LRGSFNAAPRETVYYLYSTAGPGSFDRGKSRTLAELSWNVGTSIGRVFDFGGAELRKIKHTIEPELRYLFIPGVSQSGIPLMDGIDRINRRNVATFSLTNRFWGKFAQPSALAEDRDVEMLTTGSDVRELGWLKLALSYDIDKAKKGGDPLSDLDLSLRATPMDFIAVGLEGGLNPGPWQWTQAAVLFSFRDPRPLTLRTLDGDFMQPNSFNLTYRFIRKNPFGFFSEDANIDLNSPADCVNHPLDPRPVAGCTGFTKDVLSQLSGNFLYHATDHILLFFNASYNLRDRRFTDLRAAVKLLSMCECWTITFTLKQEINPSRTGFNVDFNLLGLGSQNKGKFNR